VADSRDSIEEIRSRLNILEIISEYVTIKRAGKNHKGLCPFHAEKTPSFTVSEEFQTWHCFGCGEHGDLFTFLMKVESLTFAEAMERLAKRAGVEIERNQNRGVSRREQLVRINNLAAVFYSELLKRTPVALDYLRRRGLADSTMQQFRLGYAPPGWDGLLQHLTKQGVNLTDASEAGLLRRNDRGGYYDWFRHRIIFPILDIQERVIGFGGRAFTDDQPKYLNSPDTPLFSKTRSLYGLNLARKHMSEIERAMVTEGYMDVITAHQAGFTECVATLGTALTADQIKILSRYTKNVRLAYDADSAGMKAAMRGASMFEEAECDVRIVRLPAGDDPDSLIRSGKTAEFHDALENALPVTDYKIELIVQKHDLSSSAGRAAMLREASKVLAEVGTNAERERYIKLLARYHPNFETGTTRAEDHIRRDIEGMLRDGHPGANQAFRGSPAMKPLTAREKAENAVLQCLIRGNNDETIPESLTPEDFSGEARRKAARILFEILREKRGIYLPELLDKVEPDVGRLLSELAVREEQEPVGDEYLTGCISFIKKSKIKRLRTSDVTSAYKNQDGTIDPDTWRHGQTAAEYERFLTESGKRPDAQGQ
jgi:DNA primase